MTGSAHHALAFSGARKPAGRRIPKPPVPPPGDPVVEPVADGSWDEATQRQEAPGQPEVAGQSEHCLGADPHPFALSLVPFDPGNRIHAFQLAVPVQHSSGKVSLEWREAEGALPIGAQHQLHDPAAETAVSIEEQNW